MTVERRADGERAERHLVLPGKDLATVPLGDDDHRIALYDPDDPCAYIVGDYVEVGTDTASRSDGPRGPARDE